MAFKEKVPLEKRVEEDLNSKQKLSNFAHRTKIIIFFFLYSDFF